MIKMFYVVALATVVSVVSMWFTSRVRAETRYEEILQSAWLLLVSFVALLFAIYRAQHLNGWLAVAVGAVYVGALAHIFRNAIVYKWCALKTHLTRSKGG